VHHCSKEQDTDTAQSYFDSLESCKFKFTASFIAADPDLHNFLMIDWT